MLEHLPRDVITSEILHRLSVITLARSRCVSKEWRSLISGLKFGDHKYPRHLLCAGSAERRAFGAQLTSHKNGFYVLELNREDGFWSVVSRPFEKGTRFVMKGNSCHGLVIFKPSFGSGVLMNPFTLESLTVTDCPSDFISTRLGLGYDVYSDDYKIVLVGWAAMDRIYVTYVYSVRMKQWSRRQSFQAICHQNQGVFVNGCIHWKGYTASNGRCYEKICAFSLALEEFQELRPPPGLESTDFYKFDFKVLGGCLALASDLNACIDIWLMKQYGVQDSWTKIVIEFPREDWLRVGYEVISLLDEDEFVLKRRDALVAYNCSSGVWRDIKIVADVSVPLDVVIPVAERLVSSNSI